jgi:hypothetical protein
MNKASIVLGKNGLKDYRGRLDDLLKNHISAANISSHVSETVTNMYSEEYKFEWKGKKIMFSPHIRLGSGDPNRCLEILFIHDAATNKFVIAHIGRHLTNTKSK